MKKILLALAFIAAASAGCGRNENKLPLKTLPHNAPNVAQPLVIGLVPEQNIFRQVERYEPLTGYLSKVIGIKVDLKVLPQYGDLIKNFSSGKFDGAFFGSFTYVLAHAKLGVEVLARPESVDGTSTYYGLIFVRKDSGIKTSQDMLGKRFVFVDKATTAGYLLPLVYFRQHGIRNYKTFLKETYFAGNHEDAIYDVLDKRADIGAAKNTVYERIARSDPRINEELRILDTSPRVPENGLAVRRDLNPEIKTQLKETLLNMHNTPEGRMILRELGVRRFIETKDDDYLPVLKYAETIHLNLSAYDYIND